VNEGVEPTAGAVQGLLDSMGLTSHTDALHEPPRRVVVEEAVGDDSVHTEALEAVAEELFDGFGGVAGSGVRRVEIHPSSAWAPRAWSVTSAWAQASSRRSMKSPMSRAGATTSESAVVRSTMTVVASREGSTNV